jgi:hypothetical protein
MIAGERIPIGIESEAHATWYGPAHTSSEKDIAQGIQSLGRLSYYVIETQAMTNASLAGYAVWLA